MLLLFQSIKSGHNSIQEILLKAILFLFNVKEKEKQKENRVGCEGREAEIVGRRKDTRRHS